MRTTIIFILVAATLRCGAAEQKEQRETPFPPPGLQAFTSADDGPMGGRRVVLTNNTPEIIRAELLTPSLIHRIAETYSLPKREAEGIRIVSVSEEELLLCQFEASKETFNLMSDVLRMYTQGRYDGHSREFMMSCITNRAAAALNPPNDDLRQLTKKRPHLPVEGLRVSESGIETNETGTVSRWSVYTVTDGDITWRYYLSFNPDGSLDYVFDSKCDSKEVDPRFSATLEEVETLVTEEMKKEGSSGKLGSCHHFWHLKKKKLQERGILWRSPAELNPDTRFD